MAEKSFNPEGLPIEEELANTALINNIAELALEAQQYDRNYLGPATDYVSAPGAWSFQVGVDRVHCLIDSSNKRYPNITVIAAYALWRHDFSPPAYAIENYKLGNKSFFLAGPKYKAELSLDYSADGRRALPHLEASQTQPSWNKLKQGWCQKRAMGKKFSEQTKGFQHNRVTKTRLEFLADLLERGYRRPELPIGMEPKDGTETN